MSLAYQPPPASGDLPSMVPRAEYERACAERDQLRLDLAARDRHVVTLTTRNRELECQLKIRRLPNKVASPAERIGIGVLRETGLKWRQEGKVGPQPFTINVLAEQMGEMQSRAASPVLETAEELGLIKVQTHETGRGRGKRVHYKVEMCDRLFDDPDTWPREPRRDPNGKSCPKCGDAGTYQQVDVEQKEVTWTYALVSTRCAGCGATLTKHKRSLAHTPTASPQPPRPLGKSKRVESKEELEKHLQTVKDSLGIVDQDDPIHENGEPEPGTGPSYWSSNFSDRNDVPQGVEDDGRNVRRPEATLPKGPQGELTPEIGASCWSNNFATQSDQSHRSCEFGRDSNHTECVNTPSEPAPPCNGSNPSSNAEGDNHEGLDASEASSLSPAEFLLEILGQGEGINRKTDKPEPNHIVMNDDPPRPDDSYDRKYDTVDGHPSIEDCEAHLRGEKTLGGYLTHGQLCRAVAFDGDGEKKGHTLPMLEGAAEKLLRSGARPLIETAPLPDDADHAGGGKLWLVFSHRVSPAGAIATARRIAPELCEPERFPPGRVRVPGGLYRRGVNRWSELRAYGAEDDGWHTGEMAIRTMMGYLTPAEWVTEVVDAQPARRECRESTLPVLDESPVPPESSRPLPAAVRDPEWIARAPKQGSTAFFWHTPAEVAA